MQKRKESLKKLIANLFNDAHDKVDFLNDLREYIHSLSPINDPVDLVRWVDVEKIRANEYNPNQVADEEMKLLHTSVDHDGYTQPIVTVFDKETETFIIVDGFHRYAILKRYPDIYKRCFGKLPVTVINKDIKDRIASTIRHNRARGKHAIQGMSNIVFNLLDKGWTDSRICAELGISIEELKRLKHITGFSKLYESAEYTKAWKTRRQIEIEKEHNADPRV